MGKLLQIDGLPVVDAKHPITLEIIPSDIRKADRKNPADCAVARACRRALHAKEARIHTSRVYVRTNKGNWVRYCVPPRMKQEIVVFDRGGEFAPSKFTLAAPQPTKQLGKRRGTKTGEQERSRKRRQYTRIENVRVGAGPNPY